MQDINTELLEVCKALLPYAESSRVPGPAMSDPWKPPEDVIRRAKDVIARAIPSEEKTVANIAVYSRPECVFHYCPYVGVCDVEDRCQHASRID